MTVVASDAVSVNPPSLSPSMLAARANVSKAERSCTDSDSLKCSTIRAIAVRRSVITPLTSSRPVAVRSKRRSRRSDPAGRRPMNPARSRRLHTRVAFDACTFSSVATALGVVGPSRKIKTRTRNCGPVTRSSTAITVRATTRRSTSAARRVDPRTSSSGCFFALPIRQIMYGIGPARQPVRATSRSEVQA